VRLTQQRVDARAEIDGIGAVEHDLHAAS
jgi:hypothetical protein